MAEFTTIQTGQVRPVSSEIEVFELPISEEVREALVANGLPPTLWLGVNRNKEYPPGYRHAWGNAWVSSTQDGEARTRLHHFAFESTCLNQAAPTSATRRATIARVAMETANITELFSATFNRTGLLGRQIRTTEIGLSAALGNKL